MATKKSGGQPPKSGTNQQTPQQDPREVQRLVEAKRAEYTARQKNAQALKEEGRAYQDHARAVAADAKAGQRAADAFDDLADHADEATDATTELSRANNRSASSFEKFEKAANTAQTAVEGLEASYRLYIAAHYDAIHAANMSMRAMQKQIPQSAAEASKYIERLTDRFANLRDGTSKMATKFIIPWEEAVKNMDEIMEAFGTNLDGAAADTEKTLIELQRHMYALREATGQSFEDQLREIDFAITHLGITAQDFQSDMEDIAAIPAAIHTNMKLGAEAALRYKDILKTNGVIRAVQDMVHSLDQENVGVKRLAASYQVLIEQSIKYGRSQKEAIQYAEKLTKALYGVGDQADLFQLPNFLGGREYAAKLKAMGLNGPNSKDAEDKLRSQYLSDMGVGKDQKATQDQIDLANKKIQDLKDALAGGDVNSGALFQFAPSEEILKNKLAAQSRYGSGLASGKTVGLAGAKLDMEAILGAGNVTGKEALDYSRMYNEAGGDQEKLAQLLTKYLKQEGKGGFTPDEIAAQEKIAQERKAAEAPDVILKNQFGPKLQMVNAVMDIASNVAALAKSAGVGGGAGGAPGGALGTGGAVGASGGGGVGGAAQGVGVVAVASAQVKSASNMWDDRHAAQRIMDDLQAGRITPDQAQQQLDEAKKRRAAQGIGDVLPSTARDLGVSGLIDTVAGTDIDKRGKQDTEDVDIEHKSDLIQQAIDAQRAAQQTNQYDPNAKTRQPTSIDVNGQPTSHRSGLNYVPWDDYLANLHEGEQVLTKDKARMLRDATLRVPQMARQAVQGGVDAGSDSGTSGASASNGNMSMSAKIVGDKLVFTVEDAGIAISELLVRAKASRTS